MVLSTNAQLIINWFFRNKQSSSRLIKFHDNICLRHAANDGVLVRPERGAAHKELDVI